MKNTLLLLMLAIILISCGKTDNNFQQEIEAATWTNKGDALYELGRYGEALKCYDKAIEINPNNTTAWNNKGFVLDELVRYEEALKCYDKAIEINPNNTAAWTNKGAALYKLGRKSEAQRCYDKAKETKKKNNRK